MCVNVMNFILIQLMLLEGSVRQHGLTIIMVQKEEETRAHVSFDSLAHLSFHFEYLKYTRSMLSEGPQTEFPSISVSCQLRSLEPAMEHKWGVRHE